MRLAVLLVVLACGPSTDDWRVTGGEPDLVKAELVEPLFGRMRHVDPEVTRILKESVAAD